MLELIGGKDNITGFAHCMTRLRFNLKDNSIVSLEEIKKINVAGVLSNINQGAAAAASDLS